MACREELPATSPLRRAPNIQVHPEGHRRSWSDTNIALAIKKSLGGVIGFKVPRGLTRSKSTLAVTTTQQQALPGPAHRRANSERLPNTSRPRFFLTMAQAHEYALQDSDATHLLPTTDVELTAGAAESPTEEVKVPALLLQGTPLVKVSPKKTQTRIFRLDPDQGQIRWPSKKSGVINLESIKEIRTGDDIRQYRLQFKITPDVEPRWLTIIYLTDSKYKTLHVIAPSLDVYRMWLDTVRKLWNVRQELMTAGVGGRVEGLEGVQRREKAWERLYWKSTDETGEQQLDWNEVKKLCLRLNIHAPEEDLYGKFKEADVNHRRYLDFKDFQRFVKLLKARPEVKRLWNSIRAGGEFDFEKFKRFMQEEQKSTLTDDELCNVFHRFALIPAQSPALSPRKTLPDDPDASSDTTRQTSSSMSLSPSPSLRSSALPSLSPSEPTLSLAGFTAFLLSAENAPFTDLPQDMTRPLPEYYISSSHNTYLVGSQLVGISTTEGYIRALTQGCRSVELDIYDGDTEPQIFHGKTFTSKVPLREVCHAIAKYAFLASPYPIIISAEIHCGLAQQDLVAEIMKDAFGDALIQGDIDGHERDPVLTTLPSPETLKGRVLLKAKNLNLVIDGNGTEKETPKGVYDTESSSADDSEVAKAEQILKAEAKQLKSELEDGLNRARNVFQRVRGHTPSPSSKTKPLPPVESRPKIKMSEALEALLVYTVGVKCRGLNKKEHYAVQHVFSLSEKTANKVLKQDMMDLIKHNKTHVVRIYPKGLRLNSSNYEPHRYWAAGAQLVAINWQTFDMGYMINHAMFQRNMRLGYVLKPKALRAADKAQLTERREHFFDITIISAQQLPRAKDKEGREILDKHIIDPFVEVSLFIPDWTHSPFLDDDTPYSPPSGPNTTSSSTARTVSRRTSIVKNNGFNPIWEETLSLPFDCVGDMHELIFVKLDVKEETGEDHAPIAVYCASLGSLQQGYRHLPLHDQQLSQYLFSTLFVRTHTRDA